MDTELEQFKAILKKNQRYVTKARIRLFTTLQNHPALAIKKLVWLLPEADRATVYRNISVFAGLSIVSRLQMGWNSKVELSDMFRYHHHHFTCLDCGKIMILPENNSLEEQINKLAKSKNFKQTDHQLEIRGLCSSCQA